MSGYGYIELKGNNRDDKPMRLTYTDKTVYQESVSALKCAGYKIVENEWMPSGISSVQQTLALVKFLYSLS